MNGPPCAVQLVQGTAAATGAPRTGRQVARDDGFAETLSQVRDAPEGRPADVTRPGVNTAARDRVQHGPERQAGKPGADAGADTPAETEVKASRRDEQQAEESRQNQNEPERQPHSADTVAQAAGVEATAVVIQEAPAPEARVTPAAPSDGTSIQAITGSAPALAAPGAAGGVSDSITKSGIASPPGATGAIAGTAVAGGQAPTAAASPTGRPPSGEPAGGPFGVPWATPAGNRAPTNRSESTPGLGELQAETRGRAATTPDNLSAAGSQSAEGQMADGLTAAPAQAAALSHTSQVSPQVPGSEVAVAAKSTPAIAAPAEPAGAQSASPTAQEPSEMSPASASAAAQDLASGSGLGSQAPAAGATSAAARDTATVPGTQAGPASGATAGIQSQADDAGWDAMLGAALKDAASGSATVPARGATRPTAPSGSEVRPATGPGTQTLPNHTGLQAAEAGNPGVQGKQTEVPVTSASGAAANAIADGATVPASVSQYVAARLLRAVQQGERECHLELYPNTLGKLEVHLALGGQRLALSMVAQTEQARDLLQQALPELRVALEARGIPVGQCHVGLGNGSASGQWHGQPQHPATPHAAVPVRQARDDSQAPVQRAARARSEGRLDLLA